MLYRTPDGELERQLPVACGGGYVVNGGGYGGGYASGGGYVVHGGMGGTGTNCYCD